MSAATVAQMTTSSKKSPGPRTSEGRAVSALNSRKHGLSGARHAVLPNESSEEFETLLDDLRNDLHPVGAVEEMLVRQVAEASWLVRRAWAVEVGALVAEGADAENGAGLAVWRDCQQGKGQVLQTVTRYRSAAERSRMSALHELERRQAARSGAPVALPLALDVMVNTDGGDHR